jgi:hypothetical protein
MDFSSEKRLDSGVIEREFTLGMIPGILWTPTSAPAPLILVGHPGGLRQMYPRLAGRALDAAAYGFASVAIELPGSGDRPRSPPPSGPAPTCAGRWRPVSRSTRSSTRSSFRWSRRRSRSGRPPWTPSLSLPEIVAR